MTQRRSVFVVDLDRVLLRDSDCFLSKPMSEAILVNFLEMPASEITMDAKTSFANDITKVHHGICHIPPRMDKRQPYYKSLL